MDNDFDFISLLNLSMDDMMKAAETGRNIGRNVVKGNALFLGSDLQARKAGYNMESGRKETLLYHAFVFGFWNGMGTNPDDGILVDRNGYVTSNNNGGES